MLSWEIGHFYLSSPVTADTSDAVLDQRASCELAREKSSRLIMPTRKVIFILYSYAKIPKLAIVSLPLITNIRQARTVLEWARKVR